MNHFSIRLWCMMISGFYTTTGNDQLSDWPKKKLRSISQNQTCTPECHGHCFMVYCWSDPLPFSGSRWNHYIREVLSKLMRCTELQRLQPILFNRMDPIIHNSARLQVTRPMLQKLKELGYEVLPHLPYSLGLSPTIASSSISTTFCREKTSTTSWRQKMLPKSSLNPEAWIFMLNKLISHWQKCVDCNGSYFD